MGFLSRVWRGIKKVAGAVAMIAAPFVAAPIAGMIGVSGTLGTALTGAAIGGLGASAAGVNPMIGAAIGGLGAFGVAGRAAGAAGAANTAGAAGGMFGGAAPAAAATAVPATAAAATAAPAAAGLAAGGGLLGTGLTLGNLAPLAFALYGRAPQDLTEVERENLIANAETAATERGVFNQRLDTARSVIQQGQANPEQAYATAQLGVQRGLAEANRTAGVSDRPGLQDANRRRAAIEGTRLGTAAVTGENVRAAQTMAAGLSQLPTNVPTSASELNKTVYEDLYKRRASFGRDLASAAGQMYGNLA